MIAFLYLLAAVGSITEGAVYFLASAILLVGARLIEAVER